MKTRHLYSARSRLAPVRQTMIGLLMVLILPSVVIAQTTAASRTPAKDDKETLELDPFILNAKRSDGYGATDALAGSRINLPLVDLPLSIVVVNRTLLDDVGATDFLSSLSYVSGMNAASDVKNGAMALRGLEVRGDSFNILDGLPLGGGDTMQEVEFVERYEIVKGPAGTLYGDHSLGGLVNRVSKTPRKEFEGSAQVAVNSYGHYQTNIDVTGPLDKKGELTYRVVGVYGHGPEQLGGPDDKESYYGVIEYRPGGGRTVFYFRTSREDRTYSFENGNVLIDKNGEMSFSYFGKRDTLSQFTNDNHLVYNFYEGGVTTSASGLLGDWTFRAVARYNHNLRNWDEKANISIYPFEYTFYDAVGQNVGQIGGAGNATFSGSNWKDVKITDSVGYILPSNFEQRGFFFDASGKFNTGPADHRLLVYIQDTFGKGRTIYEQFLLTAPYGGSRSGGNLNLDKAFSLVARNSIPHNQLDQAFVRDTTPGSFSDATTGVERFNFGIQDNVYLLNERLLLSAGARYDHLYNTGFDHIKKLASPPLENTNWVYKAAAVIKPLRNKGVSVFLNYSETFTPQWGTLNAGTQYEAPIKNLEGSAKEAGIKLNLNNKLFVTASYFHNELANYLTFFFDPVLRRNIAQQGGTAIVKGWEADITYSPNDNWSFVFSPADYSSRQASNLPNRNVPEGFNYKALARYAFTSEKLSGLALGLGVVNVPKRSGDYSGSFYVNGYTAFNPFASYARGRWVFRLNAYNITDKDAIVSSLGALYYNYALERRNFLFSATCKF